jgi:type II pantothenate kinase
VIYFTRSPVPPPSVASESESLSSSPRESPSTPSEEDDVDCRRASLPQAKVTGALTPLTLEPTRKTVEPFIGESLRGALLRRATLQNVPGGSLNFERFETDNIHECVDFIKHLIERSANVNRVSLDEMRRSVKIMATGGGAHKFYELFREQLGVEVMREDEMECLITGLNFITSIPNEAYSFSDKLIDEVSHNIHITSALNELERPSPNPPKYGVTFEMSPSPQLPCLLVNIGSGVSIIKVNEDGSFERVSGTSLGGGTLWGLLSLLTPATTFDGMLLAIKCC